MHIEIIAELAQGFEGRPEQARLLLKAAAAAGADAAKFQLVFADELATPGYKYYDLFRSLEMPDDVWSDLASYANSLNIGLYLDVFGSRSLQLAEKIGAKVVKLHGTDIVNIDLLKTIADSSIPTILFGAGGACLSELDQAIRILDDKQIIVLLGFQGYPTPNEANQISRISLLARYFSQYHQHVTVGFADHAPSESPLGFALAATAIGAGARVIEKHLTLAQVMKLEDYESALNPDVFADFCSIVRGCAEALGESELHEDFGMNQSEINYRKMVRRHVIACKDLEAGTILSPSDLSLKRSSSEEAITNLELVYGKTLRKSIQSNFPVCLDDII
ncbi:MAG: N-acetylneuraminate synthase family protein [Dissulfurispiraceae bacterium]|jgi:N,N'-diacetyllegionaminate synthase|nr:N-acetylneuraminate synthase family protein [Dissulfurispiraceae bacterium]